MRCFYHYDKHKRIQVEYWVYLKGISLDFDSSWTPGSEVRIYKKNSYGQYDDELHRLHNCPRSLAWETSTPLDYLRKTLCVDYKGCDGGPSRTCVIAELEEVESQVDGHCGIAQLEIKRKLGFGTSTVRLTVRKRYGYHGVKFFKLSVVIENIHRDDWNQLLKYQQDVDRYRIDFIFSNVPYVWRGNERVIEQMPQSPHQNDQSDVANDLKHIAYQSMPLVLKYGHAQSDAIQRGLSYDDFLWESPSHHETRVVRPPSSQTDTPLRALRLDIYLGIDIHDSPYRRVANLIICGIELTLTSFTRSPSFPDNLSSCTLRLDPPYATLANATIPNHSSQIIEIPTDSQSNERVITTNGLTQMITVNVVQVMAPVAGDIFAGHIYGGNNGGRNNTNNITTPTPGTPSRRKGSVFLLRRFELLPGLRGIFRTTKQGKAAQAQESANDI